MKKLKFGQTPFHKMTKQQLVLVTCRMYSALVSTRSCLATSRVFYETSPYWGERGTGGCALSKADQALESLHAEYSSDDIYHSYFRYADDLLFDNSVFGIGFGWMVCSKCKTMLGRGGGGKDVKGKVCKDVYPFSKKRV